MSSTSLGDRLERRAIRILEGLGYTLAAQARRRPVWVRGRVVANDGSIDLLKNAFDIIAVKRHRPTIFLQVTTVSAIAGHRPKLRAASGVLSESHHAPMAFAWDESAEAFKVYLWRDDYLDAGWTIGAGAQDWPWNEPFRQEKLP